MYGEPDSQAQNINQGTRPTDLKYPAMLAISVSAPLKLDKGFIGNRVVSVLFDSGANVFGINRKYIPKSVYTGKYIKCQAFFGRVEKFPQCQMNVRTSFYSRHTLFC